MLLTEVPGVFTHAPGTPGAELVEDGDAATGAVVGKGSAVGKGGMGSKILAAELAASAGIRTVIAGGAERTCSGRSWPVRVEGRGSRRRWRATGVQALDPPRQAGRRPHPPRRGARRAVAEEGASVLAIGVAATEGRFELGDAVELVGPDGRAFAKGIAGASSRDLDGRPHGVEAAHATGWSSSSGS